MENDSHGGGLILLNTFCSGFCSGFAIEVNEMDEVMFAVL